MDPSRGYFLYFLKTIYCFQREFYFNHIVTQELFNYSKHNNNYTFFVQV